MTGVCGLPANAKAYSLNFTLVPSQPLGYLTTWPSGAPRPLVSTLNAPEGSVVANAAVVAAGAGAAIDVFVTGTTDVSIDVNGYFAQPADRGLSLYIQNSCRVADTRVGQGAVGTLGPTGWQVARHGCWISAWGVATCRRSRRPSSPSKSSMC